MRLILLSLSLLLLQLTETSAQEWRAALRHAQAMMDDAKYENARNELKKIELFAKDLYHRNPSDTTYADILESLGYCNEQLGNYEEAEVHYKASLESYLSIHGKRHDECANIYKLLGSMYSDLGRYEEAESSMQNAKEIYVLLYGDEDPKHAQIVNDMALLYQRIGKYKEAEPMYLEAKRIFTSHYGEVNEDNGHVLNNLAILYYQMGRYIKSEKLYIQSLEVHRILEGKQHHEYAKVLSNLSSLYKTLGRFKESIDLTLESMEIRRINFGEDHPLYANSLNNLATLYDNIGEHDKAEQYYLKAIEIERDNNKVEYAIFLNNLARLYQRTERYDRSEETFLEALNVLKDALGDDHPYYAIFVRNLGQLYFLMEDYARTEPLWKQALEIRRKHLGEDKASYVVALVNMGLLVKRMGRHDEADTTISLGIEKLLNLIDYTFSFMSEKEKRQFWYMINDSFEQLNNDVSIAFTQGHRDGLSSLMYNIQLATKALILDSSHNIKKAVVETADSTLMALYDRWVDKRNKITQAYSIPANQREQEGLTVKHLSDTINLLEKELSERSSAFAKSTSRRWTWQDVQKCLQPGEAAIEMIRSRKYTGKFTDSIYYTALIITPENVDTPEMVVFANGNKLESTQLERYKSTLNTLQEDTTSYDQYWKPIGESLNGISKVYFSSDGVYNLINLNTLFNPLSDKYLLDEIDIQLVTSTKDVILFSEQNETTRDNLSAVLFGDPKYDIDHSNYQNLIALNTTPEEVTRGVKGMKEILASTSLVPLANSKKEVNTIAQVLREHEWRVETFLGDRAIEENVKITKNPTVLHIATHGYFDQPQSTTMAPSIRLDLDQLPMMKSGLLLAGVSNYYGSAERPQIQDGMLTAYESATLNLDKTELVVLSACETGLGEVSSGEGVYGLQRGFKIAGAKSILMSLWNVNDIATQELMSKFYSLWLDTGNKRQAFRQAQLEIREKYPKPIHWGGFVMVGDNTIVSTNNAMNVGLLVIIVIILASSLFLIKSIWR